MGLQSIEKSNLLPTFQCIANADYIALMLLGFVNHKEDPEGKSEEGRLYRRAIVRYINLAIIETLRNVSLRTAKRFPTYDDLVACREFRYFMTYSSTIYDDSRNILNRNGDRGGNENYQKCSREDHKKYQVASISMEC